MPSPACNKKQTPDLRLPSISHLHAYDAKHRQPSVPTLFPYTTLFRSVKVGPARHQHEHGHSHLPPDALGWRSLFALGVSGGLLPCPSALVVMLAAISDRKSTRLNSSHPSISYAVSCL